jgi:hypothetical protein
LPNFFSICDKADSIALPLSILIFTASPLIKINSFRSIYH